jgi:hypothetical protein
MSRRESGAEADQDATDYSKTAESKQRRGAHRENAETPPASLGFLPGTPGQACVSALKLAPAIPIYSSAAAFFSARGAAFFTYLSNQAIIS